jgi:glycosyltransferase involved in cell wall biosynthesis
VAGVLAERRTDLEWGLGRSAARVVTVGPLLDERALVELSAYPTAPDPLRLDPGFDIREPAARRPPRGGPAQILIFGRLDDGVKGVPIAARAVGRAVALSGVRVSEVELLARGVEPEHAWEFREEVQRLAGLPGLRVITRSYTAEVARLHEDMLRATLVLMPSRAEAFGLAGLEAIVAGTPVLVSDRSGLGVLLTDLLPAADSRRIVVPVTGDDDRDAMLWGHAIATVIGDRPAAFANLDRSRRAMAAKRTWAMAAQRLLAALDTATAEAAV